MDANAVLRREGNHLVITIDASGGNQALVIDGSEIALTAGSGSTAGNSFFYSVTVSGNSTTITVNIESSPMGYTAAGAYVRFPPVTTRVPRQRRSRCAEQIAPTSGVGLWRGSVPRAGRAPAAGLARGVRAVRTLPDPTRRRR